MTHTHHPQCGMMRSRFAAQHVAGMAAVLSDLTCPTHDPLMCRGHQDPGRELVMPDGSPGPGLVLDDEELERFTESLAARCDLDAEATFTITRHDEAGVSTDIVASSVQLYRLVGERDPELARVFAGLLVAATRFNELVGSRRQPAPSPPSPAVNKPHR